jgi:hypothetical protein
MIPNQVTTMCRVMGNSGDARHTINPVMPPAANVVQRTDRAIKIKKRMVELKNVTRTSGR